MRRTRLGSGVRVSGADDADDAAGFYYAPYAGTKWERTGHKTESIYRRYAIVSEPDLSDGLRRLAALHDRDAKAVEQWRTIIVLSQF